MIGQLHGTGYLSLLRAHLDSLFRARLRCTLQSVACACHGRKALQTGDNVSACASRRHLRTRPGEGSRSSKKSTLLLSETNACCQAAFCDTASCQPR